MKYYIDKDDAVNVMFTFLKQAHDMDSNNDRLAEVLTIAKNVVNEIPPADVVPVIRCKDCKWWHDNGTLTGFCERLGSLGWFSTDYRDYCSFAERKDDETI